MAVASTVEVVVGETHACEARTFFLSEAEQPCLNFEHCERVALLRGLATGAAFGTSQPTDAKCFVWVLAEQEFGRFFGRLPCRQMVQ